MNNDNIFETINKVSLSFLEPLSLQEVYAKIIDGAQKLVEAEYGSLILEQDGQLRRVHSTLPVADQVYFRKSGFTYKAFAERKAYVRHSENFGRVHPSIKELGVKSNIFIPLSYKGKSVGVLIVNSLKKEKFKQKDLNILKLFGSMITLAIRKSQLYDETRQALDTRDLFISLAAHELRTPLTAVNGYAQLIHNKLKNGEHETEFRWSEELVGECRRLTALVNELLTVNQIKSGQLQFIFQEVQLSEVVRKSLATINFRYPHRVTLFNTKVDEDSDIVIGDKDKLLQVVSNIIDNAIKFSPPHTEINIDLTKKGSDLLLRITDKGRGIDQKDLDNIFESYYRASKNVNEEGMGLGLFLTRYIINRHNGHIKVASKLGKGTRVEISLPKAHI